MRNITINTNTKIENMRIKFWNNEGLKGSEIKRFGRNIATDVVAYFDSGESSVKGIDLGAIKRWALEEGARIRSLIDEPSHIGFEISKEWSLEDNLVWFFLMGSLEDLEEQL